MNKTTIDWPNLAYSWNPIVGCKNGCYYCYAKKIAKRFDMVADFNTPTFFEHRLSDPYKVKKPSTIFVGSMCDIFSKGVGVQWIDKIITVAYNCAQHDFMFLTKLPENYKRFSFPYNCWLGTTAESGSKYFRVDSLSENTVNRKFVSIEPLLGQFDGTDFTEIDLLIIGADTSPKAEPPKQEWINSIKHPNIWYKKNIIKHFPDLTNEQLEK